MKVLMNSKIGSDNEQILFWDFILVLHVTQRHKAYKRKGIEIRLRGSFIVTRMLELPL